MDTQSPLPSQGIATTYPLPAGFAFADQPRFVHPQKPRDAAIIDLWLTSDDGTIEVCIDAQCDVDFDRDQIVKVIGVDSILFREPKSTTAADIRHSLSPEAQKFWIGRAQVYANNLGQWEMDMVRDRVRGVVALCGNQ